MFAAGPTAWFGRPANRPDPYPPTVSGPKSENVIRFLSLSDGGHFARESIGPVQKLIIHN